MKLRNAISFLSSYYFNLFLGKMLGISHIVKYLRNPNPLVTPNLLRAFGAKIGEATTFKRTIYLDNVFEDINSAGDFSHLEIGKNCYFGDCVYLDLADEIVVKDNVVVSGLVSFVTHADCNRSEVLNTLFPRSSGRITIEDDSWIAFRVTLLPGVTIGKRAVIAANSLVRADIDDDTLCAGVPAVKIRDLKPQGHAKCITR
jgi:acetyltransferase-like isoleucine patch superfamily enzyme